MIKNIKLSLNSFALKGIFLCLMFFIVSSNSIPSYHTIDSIQFNLKEAISLTKTTSQSTFQKNNLIVHQKLVSSKPCAIKDHLDRIEKIFLSVFSAQKENFYQIYHVSNSFEFSKNYHKLSYEFLRLNVLSAKHHPPTA